MAKDHPLRVRVRAKIRIQPRLAHIYSSVLVLPQMGRLRNVATGCFIFLCLSGICLLPGSNVCGSLFHLEASLPGTTVAICISLKEATESDPDVYITCERRQMGRGFTSRSSFCLLLANICVRIAASGCFIFTALLVKMILWIAQERIVFFFFSSQFYKFKG